MSRAVPNKLVSYGTTPIGISHKQFDITFNSQLPTNSSGGSIFKYNGLNRILFTIPSYQNVFLDNARSHLAFTFKTTLNGTQLCTNLGTSCLFSRMIIKSGANVLEDISNLDVLNKILTSMSDKDESRLSEACYTREFSGGLTSAQTRVVATKQKTGVELQYIFRHGILHEHLKSFLPLHSMNPANGVAFTIELYLNDPTKVLQWDADTEPANLSTASYELSNVRYQMCLLKADQSIVDRFNNLSSDGRVVVPFSTFRAHQNGLSAETTITQIAEACSDLRRISTVIVSGSSKLMNKAVDNQYPAETSFLGGFENSTLKIKEYQLQVGNKFIFTESLKSETDNGAIMAQVKNASFSRGHGNMLLEAIDQTGLRPSFENTLFHLTSSFCYERSDLMVNGISLGSLPLIMKLTCNTIGSGNIIVSQAECGLNLIIQNGMCSIADSKDPGEFGY